MKTYLDLILAIVGAHFAFESVLLFAVGSVPKNGPLVGYTDLVSTEVKSRFFEEKDPREKLDGKGQRK